MKPEMVDVGGLGPSIREVIKERRHQINTGRDLEHDLKLSAESLTVLAIYYAWPSGYGIGSDSDDLDVPNFADFLRCAGWHNVKDIMHKDSYARHHHLIVAAALILAEYNRRMESVRRDIDQRISTTGEKSCLETNPDIIEAANMRADAIRKEDSQKTNPVKEQLDAARRISELSAMETLELGNKTREYKISAFDEIDVDRVGMPRGDQGRKEPGATTALDDYVRRQRDPHYSGDIPAPTIDYIKSLRYAADQIKKMFQEANKKSQNNCKDFDKLALLSDIGEAVEAACMAYESSNIRYYKHMMRKAIRMLNAAMNLMNEIMAE